MYKCNAYTVIEKTAISAGIFSFVLLCPEVAAAAREGQFVHIKVEGYLLRRPISICDIDRKNGTIRIVFEIRGGGTARLSGVNVGDNLDIIAPLGNGFTLPDSIAPDRRLIVLGGGIGTPPLLAIAGRFRESVTAILGFRSYDKIILANDFKAYDAYVIACTDDGSVGHHGVVTQPLDTELAKNDVDAVYVCGPTPMLKAAVAVCERHNTPVQVSLEERMGCGVGACAVCACKIRSKDGETVKRVCKDGPVFNGSEVIFS
jgi:dihydroorotate dehydrogenase electron transfer subunit